MNGIKELQDIPVLLFKHFKIFRESLEPVTELGKIAPNILKRNFKAAMPNEKWATDVTEFNVSGNKLYLSPIIDLFNGEIISYALSERPHFNQIVNMLKKSFEKIPDKSNLIPHSDQGWQYQLRQ